MLDFTKKSLTDQQLTNCAEVVESARLEIKKMWRIFYSDDKSVFELRALWPKGVPKEQPPIVRHYKVSDYPSLEACKAAFELDALILNTKGYNIYTLLNPLNPDFSGKGGANNSDILYRDLLLVDIDRTVSASEPATDTEVDAAKALAIQIRLFMDARGWAAPFVVMSGNGYHLYYVLDGVGNDQAASDMVKLVLKELAAKFDNAIASVDTSVHNAARITKVPGTIMRKGTESVDRPYRVAEVCDEL
jgi:hypothetical protein